MRLFNTPQVLPKDDIDSLRRDRVKMLALNRDFKQLQESSARLARRHQQLSKSARNVASRADRAELEVARLVGVVDGTVPYIYVLFVCVCMVFALCRPCTHAIAVVIQISGCNCVTRTRN